MKTIFPVALGVAMVWPLLGIAGGRTKARNPLRAEAAAGGAPPAVVKAVGTVEPEEVVDVGAQVGGKILKFGADPARKGRAIDVGSTVKAGMVLLQLDRAPYEAAVEQAKARQQRAEATLRLAEARVTLAERELQRVQKRRMDKTADGYDVAVAQAVLDVARAGAAVEAVGAAQGRAALKKAERNLEYTTIRAPCDGIVVDRRVNQGQIVTAGLTAPSLFLLAKDLKRLQVWATVKEADIGRVAKGQAATFTVDAFPKETFKGKVTQIRLNAAMPQKAVTYTVIIEVDNRDRRLVPHLTAEVSIAVGARQQSNK